MIAAALVLLWPRSVVAVLVLAAMQIAFAWHESPFIPNHYLFAALVNLAVLLAAGLRALRRQPVLDGGALVELFGPPVRLALLLLYGFVVLHKLNADFFDPVTSCGTMFYLEQRAMVPWLPEGRNAYVVAIALALGVEAAIGVLLAFRRTRHAGIVVGALFHWMLALSPYDRFYNFSSLLLALFALFASPAALSRGLALVGDRRWRLITRGVLALIALAAILGKYAPELMGGDRYRGFLLLWIPYGLGVIGAWVWLMRTAGPGEPAPALGRPSLALAAIPLAAALNGAMPYLGLKTETAWAMFSNLRTEGGHSNHYLLPASLQIFSYQRQLVRLHDSSDRFLRHVAGQQQLLPAFELQRRPHADVMFTDWQQQTRSGKIADLFPEAIPLWKTKLLYFRPVDASERQGCRH
jgi:hypothetical protein